MQEIRVERFVDYNLLSDAHCHLDLFNDYQDVINAARFGGVGIIVTCGGNNRSNLASIDIAENNDGVFAVVGIDPQAVKEEYNYIDGLEKIVMKSKKVIGLGEIGLDFKLKGLADKKKQKEAFEEQIEIAKRIGLPIVVHSRSAIDEVIDIVLKSKIDRALFHFFEGDANQAALLAKSHHLISFPPAESSKRKKVIKEMDLSSITVETDSPAVGKSPLDVSKVIGQIADIKGLSFEEVALKTTENVKEFFYI